MSRAGSRSERRVGLLALLTAALLLAAAQQSTNAAPRKRANIPVDAAPAPAPVAPAPPPVAPAPPPVAPAVGSAATTGSSPVAPGYWLVGRDGGVYAFGSAPFHGSTGAMRLNKPIVGMAPTPSGAGYWLVASDGGIFAFGDAGFHGSTGAIRLNRPIVGMTPTRSGRGYWLVATDGGIFAFGDAAFYGSTGHLKLARPVTGMAALPGGRGYWLTASDGGLFAFGNAQFFGAAREKMPPGAARGVVAMVPTASGAGYWQVTASGKVYAFGDAPMLGAAANPKAPIVGMAARTGAGPVPIGPLANDGPAPQRFDSRHKFTWGTSPSTVESDKAGRALAVVEAGRRVFIGGEFEGMVPPNPTSRKAAAEAPVTPRPYLAALDAATGTLLDWSVEPDKAVLSLAVSPDGRTLYVGGKFTRIAGEAVGRVAAIDIESRRLRPGFHAPLVDGPVKALALHGNTLYIGGDFEHVGDTPRSQLAALDATTGALRTGFVPPANEGGYYEGQTGRESTSGENNGVVQDLGVTADGRYLVVVGTFLRFGGQGGILVVDGATGAPAAWQPDIDRPVLGVVMWPADHRTFFVATGGTGGTLQAFRIADAAPVPADDGDDDDRGGRRRGGRPSQSDSPRRAEALWEHRTDGDATDVAATRERVYLVGHYDYVLGENTTCRGSTCTGGAEGDVPNRHISAFDPATGAQDLDFAPQLNTPQGPYAVAIGADSLYVVGDFTEANGAPQPGFVQFPALR